MFYKEDARNLRRFAEHSFGFVLFSCNGIDYATSYPDRLKMLSEARRVLARDGYLAFSSHNLNTIRTWGRPQLSLNPVRAVRASYVNLRRHRVNDLVRAAAADHSVLNDGAHHWQLDTFYVRPRAQVRVLEALGFEDIRVLDAAGMDVTGEQLESNTEPWLHYLCKRGAE
jgi:SAM-dependent methyltransferase